jgi:hypothetical protein
MGHEGAFPPTTLSNRSRLGKPTFAGTLGNEEDAPKAVCRTAVEPRGSTLKRRSPPDRLILGLSRKRSSAPDCWTCRRRSSQLIEQCLGVLQVGGVEALGEPAIDRCQQRMRLCALALVMPRPREAGRGALFPELGVLLLCECKRLAIAGLRCRMVAGLSKKIPSQTKGLG